MKTHLHRPHPFIKVCGQTHSHGTDAAIAFGSLLLGFIFHQASPRYISPSRVALINTGQTRRVGVFVQQSAPEILRIMTEAKLHYAQFHGKQERSDAEAIGAERVIRVLWPEKHENIASLQSEIDHWSEHCAYFLLDAGRQGGGHGYSLDCSQLKQLHFPKDWILAGGLNEQNIQRLIEECKPDGIDLNSGIEYSPGLKQNTRMLATIQASTKSIN